jgi:DNA repair protein RecN (Recombination protein N)
MLKSIYISNYALISELKIDFQSGFSVITGETGAGKSIILGALSLIMGQRADSKSIKIDAEKCVIEAEFDVSNYRHLSMFFIQNDLENDGKCCIIRRELTNSGKSRAFINDTPVALNLIKDLSNRLVDIHSQHENLLLSNELYQLEVVDTIALNNTQIAAYKQCFEQWRTLLAEQKKLQSLADKQSLDLDYIKFQYTHLTEANLIEGEQEELEQELDTLIHAEEIKSNLRKSVLLLNDDNASLSQLNECMNSLAHIKSYITDGDGWSERLQTAYIDLKDICSEMSMVEERVEYNPSRTEWVENRLSEIFSLQKKHKVSSVSELIIHRDELAKLLDQIDSFDDEIKAKEAQIQKVFEELTDLSNKLTSSRRVAIQPIEDYLVTQLVKLGMPNIQFQVAINVSTDFTEHGRDEVQFLFSANKNRPLQPVAQIASGGEVSRVMLALKSLIAHKSDLPTVIFDEIDTGVSGEIAHKMGDIMSAMSNDMQVITITHLPQIAAKGVAHYKVFKDDTATATETHIKKLTSDERLTELAQMLSGINVTEGALQNARELLGSR